MAFGRPNLGSILVRNRTVDEAGLECAVQYQLDHGCRLGEALTQLGICTDVEIARALAEQLEIPFVDLTESPPLPSYTALVPREIALEYGVVPVRMENGRLLAVARDPFDIRVDEVLRQTAELPVRLGIAPESQLNEAIHQYYSAAAVEDAHVAPSDFEVQVGEDDSLPLDKIIAGAGSVSAIRIVHSLIADAVERSASDLHLEPEQGYLRVRYRVDGRLQPMANLQRSLMPSVAARIKVMCGMDIADSRKPQDGACRVKVLGRNIELRVSTLPGVYGESVVLRILDQDARLQSLESIGMDADTLPRFRGMLAARQGMLLITGPTGAGKTTTLYGALGHLNREELKLITVEDPVEVKLPGLTQVEVHERAGRSFAATLRAMLRQDPDVIMVGEIRDLETADIACRAALTGHLVLSTLHTLDTVSTVTRLVDMGVAAHMLAASLNAILAQRLARTVCESCAEPYEPPAELLAALLAQFGSVPNTRFRRGRGCPRCQQRGVRGRVGIFEMLTVDEGFRQLLTSHATPSEMRDHVRTRGDFHTLEEDAYWKACRGIIPPEEVVNLGLSLATSLEAAAASDVCLLPGPMFGQPKAAGPAPAANGRGCSQAAAL